MFRLTHISDTHGTFPNIPRGSLMVVHSGDMLPNLTRGIVEHEIEFQREWLRGNMGAFKEQIADRYFVRIPGNHDYYDPVPDMKAAGIRVIDITDKLVKICGINFYGFPYVPFIEGEWNYESLTPEMSKRVNELPTDSIDILVAHCPPFGILCDEMLDGGKGGGNSSLANWLNYTCTKLPQLLLCGHFHESHGITRVGDMVVSNAATVAHTFEVPF